jgi:hypothetical protein
MDVREIEGLADFVVAVAALVFGQQMLDAQAWEMQQVAQGVLIFQRGEAAKQRTPCLCDAGRIGIVQEVIEQLQRVGVFFFRWPHFARLRRHFTGGDAIVNECPLLERRVCLELHRQRFQIEPAFLRG